MFVNLSAAVLKAECQGSLMGELTNKETFDAIRSCNLSKENFKKLLSPKNRSKKHICTTKKVGLIQ